MVVHRWFRLAVLGLTGLALAVGVCGCAQTVHSAAASTAAGSHTFPAALPPPPIVTVDEYPIAAEGEDAPDHLEYMQRIPVAVLAKRSAWRESPLEKRVSAANSLLERLGFRLEAERRGAETTWNPQQSYALLKKDRVVQADIQWFWPVSVNGSDTDFALWVEDGRGRAWLVSRDRIAPWEAGRHAYMPPVYVGDELVMVDVLGKSDDTYQVRKGDRSVYSVTVPGPRVDNPIKGLWSWDGQWVLEVAGNVIVNGTNLNQQAGYAEAFGWRLLYGKPLYFFKQEDGIHICYDDSMLPHTYDDVIHYRCYEQTVFNVGWSDDMVWFHALRDGMWCYVEIGAYQTATN